MDKQCLRERDICTRFIALALQGAGWDEMTQIRDAVSFAMGRMIAPGTVMAGLRAGRGRSMCDSKRFGISEVPLSELAGITGMPP